MALRHWQRIAHDSDGETLIFRKFDRIAARSLWYQQCEMLELEHRLDDLDCRRRLAGHVGLDDASRTWEELLLQEKSKNDLLRDFAQEYKSLILQIRQEIKAYHEALLLQSQISHLQRPRQRAVAAFRDWFRGSVNGVLSHKSYPVLGGRAKRMLDDKRDLAGLNVPSELDLLSEFMRRHWPTKIDRNIPGVQTSFFSNRTINHVVVTINTITAAILLIGSILGLYFASSAGVKLGLISGFTATFAGCLSIMTRARTVEIFAATAAYAAVLAVFVSSDIDNSSKPSLGG